jgi:hypothetical protein
MMRHSSPTIAPNEEMRQAHSVDLAHSNDGGATGTRTPDPLLAKQMLSQLSYRPIRMQNAKCKRQNAKGQGLLPFTFCILHFQWWAWVDSNHRPPSYQDGALTS